MTIGVGVAADRHRHGAGPRAQGRDRQRPDEGRRVPVQEEQDRLDQGDGAADRATAASTSSKATSRRCARARRSSSPPDRRRGACRASRSIAAHHHQRRSDPPAGGAEVDRDHGQRRGRRRVRVDLPPVRQRRDDRRAAAAARAGRGRSGVGGAREVVPEAGHHRATRARGSRQRRPSADGVDIDVPARRRHHAGLCARTICSWRPAAVRSPTGLDAEGVGLQMEKGYIKVDAQYRTSVPGISAIGDVITLGGPGIRSSRTCRRPRASSRPSASRDRTSGRSTTTTCRAAPTAIRKSAASA